MSEPRAGHAEPDVEAAPEVAEQPMEPADIAPIAQRSIHHDAEAATLESELEEIQPLAMRALTEPVRHDERTAAEPARAPRRHPVAFGSISGQGLVEYGLILSLIALVAVVALVFFGDQLAAALELIGDEIDRAST